MRKKLTAVLIATTLCLTQSLQAGETVVPLAHEGAFEALVQAIDRSLDQFGCVGTIAVEIPDIRFDNDRASLQLGAYGQMDIIARALSEVEHDHFVIEGHASATGSDAHNLDLSHRRAMTVQREVVQRGVSDDRLSIRWYGERRLLYPWDPAHADNRRVTIRRVGANSAQIGAYTAGDGGSHSITAQIMRKGGERVYAADPAIDVFRTGEPVFMCVSASRAGLLYVEQRENTSTPFEVVGSWVMQAEGLVRYPASPGIFRFEGRRGNEQIRLRHVDCNVAACGTATTARLESLRVDNKMRSQPASVGKAFQNACNQRGVQCLILNVRHE